MGIFKSIGLFAVDIVKDMISDALQLEKYQKKNKLGKIETNYTGAIDGLQKRTAKWHEDTRKKYGECKKQNG